MKRKVIWSIATILISIPLLMDTPLAEGNNVRTWAYGTYSSDFNSALNNAQVDGVLNIPFGSSSVPIPIVKTRAYQEINFQMTNYMDGYISFYFDNMPSTNLCDLYVSNATIQSWNYQTGYLSLAINGVDNFTVTLVNRSTFASWLTSEVGITWSGISLTAVNAPAYSLHNMDLKLADCNNTLSSILSAVDNLEGYTDGIESLLNDIKTFTGYLDDIYSTEQNIATDVNNIYSRLGNIVSYVDQIEGYINQLEDYTDGIEGLLTNIGNNTDTLETKLESLLNNLSYFSNLELPTYSWSFYRLLSRKYPIQTGDVFPRPYFSVTTDNTTNFSWDYAIQLNAADIYIVMATYNASSPNVKFINSSGNDVTSSWSWTFRYVGRLRYYYTKVPSNLLNNSVNIKFTADTNVMPIYIGRLRNMPLEVNQLIDIDSNDAYVRKMAEIKSAIENMAVNVNNMTVNATGITYNVNNTQVNNSVTTYNTDIENIYNVENDFSTTFNTYNEQFTPDFTETMTTIQNVPSVMNGIVIDLYNLPFIKYPLLLTLAGIVLIALLGV